MWFKRNRTDLDLPLFLVAWGIFLLRTTLFRENWIKPLFHNYCLSLNCFAGISRTFAPFLPVLCRLKHARLRKCAGKGKNFPDFASPLSGNKRSGNGQGKVIHLAQSSFWLLNFFLLAILDNVCGIEVVEFHTLSAFLPFTAKLWHLFFYSICANPSFPIYCSRLFFFSNCFLTVVVIRETDVCPPLCPSETMSQFPPFRWQKNTLVQSIPPRKKIPSRIAEQINIGALSLSLFVRKTFFRIICRLP